MCGHLVIQMLSFIKKTIRIVIILTQIEIAIIVLINNFKIVFPQHFISAELDHFICIQLQVR